MYAFSLSTVAVWEFYPQHAAHAARRKSPILEPPSKLDPGNAGNVFLNVGHRNGAVSESPRLSARGFSGCASDPGCASGDGKMGVFRPSSSFLPAPDRRTKEFVVALDALDVIRVAEEHFGEKLQNGVCVPALR